MARICLIVDNPLRDLDGLVLLARDLALRGLQPFLVPMYTQAFAVAAIKPDLVVANYARPNNIDLIKSYRRRGIRVAILDTEGAGGRNAEEFASLVRQGGAVGNVDLYCAWGVAQFEALRPLLGATVKATGCPRYDFCAPNWRPALRRPPVPPGFVLINTNFPGVNPRFSSGTSNEKQVAAKIGFDAGFVDRYLGAASAALDEIIALTRRLVRCFPDSQFVLRPHPFESRVRYETLCDAHNFSIHQEGSSLEWIAAASLLLHLNCSTAVEAVMLGKPPISPGWLDDPELRVPGPSSVSLHARNEDGLYEMVETALAGRPMPVDEQCRNARDALIRSNYLAIDGLSTVRVADAIADVIKAPMPMGRLERPGVRVTAISTAQRALGPDVWLRMVDQLSGGANRERRAAKSFSAAQVNEILFRLESIDGRAVTGQPFAHASTATGVIEIRAAEYSIAA